eukprot:3328807-Pleurochrysis_carterae.AAC.1
MQWYEATNEVCETSSRWRTESRSLRGYARKAQSSKSSEKSCCSLATCALQLFRTALRLATVASHPLHARARACVRVVVQRPEAVRRRDRVGRRRRAAAHVHARVHRVQHGRGRAPDGRRGHVQLRARHGRRPGGRRRKAEISHESARDDAIAAGPNNREGDTGG